MSEPVLAYQATCTRQFEPIEACGFSRCETRLRNTLPCISSTRLLPPWNYLSIPPTSILRQVVVWRRSRNDLMILTTLFYLRWHFSHPGQAVSASILLYCCPSSISLYQELLFLRLWVALPVYDISGLAAIFFSTWRGRTSRHPF